MKKCAFFLVMTAGVGLALAGPTGPAYQVNTGGAYYLPSGAPQHGNEAGGAFSFTALGAGWEQVGRSETQTYHDVPGFQTFCVETTQNINLNTTYYSTIDDAIYYDGGQAKQIADFQNIREVYATYFRAGGGNAGMDAIAGAGASYFGSLNRYDQNWVLQSYIWQELGYGDYWGIGSRTLGGHNVAQIWDQLDLVTSQYASNVRVLNIWADNNPEHWTHTPGYDLQSQLIYVVPVPAAAVLGVIGFGLVGWLKRRLA